MKKNLKNIIDSLCFERIVGQQKEDLCGLWGGEGGFERTRRTPPPYGHDLVLIFSWQFEDPVKLTFKQ